MSTSDDLSESLSSQTSSKLTQPSPPFKMSIGMMLHERYCIQSKLGQGGMSVVYEAVDQTNHSKVAIKQIITPFSIEEDNALAKEAMERLRREYYLLHGLQHPNLIRVFDLFEEHDQFFLVMEIIDGISLQDFIQRQTTPIPLLEQLAIAYHATSAVDALNHAGIIHRDIKPANIMLIPETNRVVLLDLGLAKSLRQDMHDITATGSIVGTTEYLSPEQVNGDITNRSDIFSLGITLYQFFSWQKTTPFKSKSPITTMSNVLTLEIPPLRKQIKQHLTRFEKIIIVELSELLQKALIKDPDQRLSSVSLIKQSLANLYQRLQNEQPVSHPVWHIEGVIPTPSLSLQLQPSQKFSYYNLWYRFQNWLPYITQPKKSHIVQHIHYWWRHLPIEIRWGLLSMLVTIVALIFIFLLRWYLNR